MADHAVSAAAGAVVSRLMVVACVVLLSACASLPGQRPILPEPRLAPVAMAVDVAVSQRLCFTLAGSSPPCEPIEARLEIDAQALRLAGFAFGRRVIFLRWDGAHFQEQRAPQLPATVDAGRILRDIQYAYAPLDALQAALSSGWAVVDRGNVRELRFGRTLAVHIRHETMPPWTGAVRLDNRVEGYRLDIEAVADADEPN